MPEIKVLHQTDILYRHWTAQNSKAVFLMVHGLGAHSSRWNFLAEYLSTNNIESYALDLKGFGNTTTTRGHIDSFKYYYNDIIALAKHIKKENPKKKIFLLGESLGGLISFNLTIANPEIFDGLITLSPAFKNNMNFKISDYIKLVAYLLFSQTKTLLVPFTSEMCTRDKEYQKIMNHNPLEIRIASAKLLLNSLIAQIRAKLIAKKLKTPTLFLLAGRDQLVDKQESRNIFSKLPIKDKKLIEYPEMYHALSIDLDREKVFSDILDWTSQRI